MESGTENPPTLPEGLTPQQAARLESLKPGNFCSHRSWGIGKIVSWNTDLGEMVINFANKAGHTMQLIYAAESLSPLPDDHIEAMILNDPTKAREVAVNNPLEILSVCIKSFGAAATAERIERTLTPALIPATDWKKWWDSTKRQVKKDTRYHIPSRRTEPITFQDTPTDHRAKAVEEITAAIGAKAILKVLPKVEQYWKASDDKGEAQTVVDILNKSVSQTPKSQLVLIIELILARDAFIEKAGLTPAPANVSLEAFLPVKPEELSKLLTVLPATRQTQCLERTRKLRGDQWPMTFISLIPGASGKTMDAIYNAFEADNRVPEVVSALDRLIRERNVLPDLLVWVCRNRKGEVGKLIGPQFFTAIVAILEYDQLSDYKRGTRLHDLLIDDKSLIRDLLSPASDEEVRDITRTVLLTPAFEDLNKRSLLAAMVKLYPFLGVMVVKGDNRSNQAAAAAAAPSGAPLIVSWPSLERRKAELEEIVNKKIPENTRDINIARSYGDLRENHEFKAAKEMQTVLMRRKAELEVHLTQAQGTDFKDVITTEVSIGTIVTLSDTETNETLEYTVLGAWDSEPEKGILSYLTGIAKVLMGQKVGASIDLPLDKGGSRHVKILSIKPYAA